MKDRSKQSEEKKKTKIYGVLVLAGIIMTANSARTLTEIIEDQRIESTTEDVLEVGYIDVAKAIYAERFNKIYGQNIKAKDITFDMKYGYNNDFELKKEKKGKFIYRRKIEIDQEDLKKGYKGSGCVLIVEIKTPEKTIYMQTSEALGNIYCVFDKDEIIDESQVKMSELYTLMVNMITAQKNNSFLKGQKARIKSKRMFKGLIKNKDIDVKEIRNLLDKSDLNNASDGNKQDFRTANTYMIPTMKNYIKTTTGLDVRFEEPKEDER